MPKNRQVVGPGPGHSVLGGVEFELVRGLLARSERDGRPGCTLSGSPDAMISPEERNAATVGALLSLSPPRGAGGKAHTGAGTTGMEALRPTLWRQSDGLVTRRFVG